jgi:hypothetical protein
MILETLPLWNMKSLRGTGWLFARREYDLFEVGIASQGVEILISLRPNAKTGLKI